MRHLVPCCTVAALILLASPSAEACDPGVSACRPEVVVFPVDTLEGVRIGTVEAPVRPVLPLERSRFTGQPLTVVYNDPTRIRGTVSPYVELVPLPRTRPSRIRAVYPRGY